VGKFHADEVFAAARTKQGATKLVELALKNKA
jgi:hypothetical protein